MTTTLEYSFPLSSALFPRLPFHPTINLPPRSIGEAVLEAVFEASAARKEPISTTLNNEGSTGTLLATRPDGRSWDATATNG